MLLLFRRTPIKCRKLTKFQLHNLQAIRGVVTNSSRIVVSEGKFDGPNQELLNHLLERYKEEKALKPLSSNLPGMLRAIESIHKLDFQFTIYHNPKSIPDVDEHVTTHIMSFFSPRKSDRRKLLEKKREPLDEKEIKRVKVVRQLQQVNGIGPIKASLLWKSGCESFQQLKEEQFLNLLPGPIRKIFEYERKTNTALSRQHVEQFRDSLRTILPGEFDIHLVGDYRLGRKQLNAVDILLFHPTYTSLPRVISISKSRHETPYKSPSIYPISPGSLFKESVIGRIKERKLEVITFSSDDNQWDGLIKINNEIIGRTRFHLMPTASKVAALLIFTGGPGFAAKCRHAARKHRLRLNEYGLWRTEVSGSEKGDQQQQQGVIWNFVEISDEAALLEKLGMSYVEPHKRDFVERDVMNGPTSAISAPSEKPPRHVTKSILPVIQDRIIGV